MPPKTTKSRKTKVKKPVVVNKEEVDNHDVKPVIEYETNIEKVEYEPRLTPSEIARRENRKK